jgi:hypothetical protein
MILIGLSGEKVTWTIFYKNIIRKNSPEKIIA